MFLAWISFFGICLCASPHGLQPNRRSNTVLRNARVREEGLFPCSACENTKQDAVRRPLPRIEALCEANEPCYTRGALKGALTLVYRIEKNVLLAMTLLDRAQIEAYASGLEPALPKSWKRVHFLKTLTDKGQPSVMPRLPRSSIHQVSATQTPDIPLEVFVAHGFDAPSR